MKSLSKIIPLSFEGERDTGGEVAWVEEVV